MSQQELYNERVLLQQVSEGSEAAFGELYRFYRAELRPLFFKHVYSDLEAEDLTQETFLKIWLHRDQLPEIKHFRAWLFTVASRVYLTALRKKLHYNKRLDTYATLPHTAESPQSPYQAASLHELKACIAEAIGQLSPQRRTVYEMSRHQGLKTDDIARLLRISPQTVKNMLQQATRFIREHLAASGHGALLVILHLIFSDH